MSEARRQPPGDNVESENPLKCSNFKINNNLLLLLLLLLDSLLLVCWHNSHKAKYTDSTGT